MLTYLEFWILTPLILPTLPKTLTLILPTKTLAEVVMSTPVYMNGVTKVK
jgi:hypothetical protein